MQNVADVYRLTPRQRHLLAAPAAGVGQAAWTQHGADPAAVADAWRRAVARHPVLRTAVFAAGMDEPVQVVLAEAGLPLRELDWSAVSANEREARLAELAAEERARGFDPMAAPLMRLVAVRLESGAYHFVWTWSALVLDDRSAALCLAEVLAGGEPAARTPFRAYVAWLERQDAARAAQVWRAALAGFAGPSQLLPGDAGDAAPTREHRLPLEPAVAERLRTLVQQQRIDWSTLAAAAWALVLRAHTGGGDVTLGLAVPGRPAGLAGGEGMLGSLRNVLPLRLTVDDGAPASALLRAAHDARNALRPVEHVAPAQVREWAELAADAALWESVVDAHAAADDPLAAALGSPAIGGLSRVSPADDAPLRIVLHAGEEVALRLAFDPDRLSAVRAAALLHDLAAVLDGMAADPARRAGDVIHHVAVAEPEVRVGASPVEEVRAVLGRNPALAGVTVAEERDGLVARVAAHPEALRRDEARRRLRFSLFYFADAADDGDADKYRLLLEGATFADRHGFEAVWVPERHFHENGGLYPNPSLLACALAPITRHVHLRAGSVALPLHHPLRVAEEWSVVDNLSGGRAGISVTSGWIPNDFALAPQNFAHKREAMFRILGEVQTLWRGGTLPVKDGAGNDVALRIFPRPLQPELPVWITCSGDPAVFERAGELGHHCLTALLTQPMEEAAEKIRLYREARARAGHDADAGHVTLMLHTFVGPGADEVLARVREPLTGYLRSHIGLMETLVKSLDLKIDINEPQWLDSLASFAFERYYRAGAFIGTPESCLPMVDRVAAAGVDEVACLIDFGVDPGAVIAALPNLDVLRALCRQGAETGPLALRRWLERRVPALAAPVRFAAGDDGGGEDGRMEMAVAAGADAGVANPVVGAWRT